MPDFFAFAGLRYDCDAAGTDLEALAAPPYDVIDEDQRAALEAADAAQRGAAAPPPRRARRRRPLRPARPPRSRRGSDRACSRVDAAPRFYSYRMQFRDPHGDAAPHARRDRRARAPRARRHERAPPRAHRGQGEVRPARAAARDAGERRPDLGPQPRGRASPSSSSPTRVLATCVDADGVVHELGAIDDPARIAEIRARIGARAGRARRRPPPLRDRVRLPRRAPRRGRDQSAAPARS